MCTEQPCRFDRICRLKMKTFSFSSSNFITVVIVFISISTTAVAVDDDKAGGDEVEGIASDYPWTYVCVNNTLDGPACQRKLVQDVKESVKVPLKVCILTCGRYGALWPYPTKKASIGKSLSTFSIEDIILGNITIPDDNEVVGGMIMTAIEIFKGYVNVKSEDAQEIQTNDRVKVNLNIKIRDPMTYITIGTNESYTLRISTSANNNSDAEEMLNVDITAETFFGARHALETLAQLIEFNEELKAYQIVNKVEIEDAPVFRHRGLLIDTARNFIPIKDLKRLVDGLSHNKMSILHWHLTDSNSYPFYSKRVPQMAVYGTISAKKIYKPSEVADFIKYANQRGIKVIPELDTPAHAGNGWQFGEREGLGELSLCVNAEPYYEYCIQPPCGQLNPINDNVYDVLGNLYKDLLDVFPNDYFHMGGDEISFKCWNSSNYPKIKEWMKEKNVTDMMSLWGHFQTKAFAKLKDASNGKIPISAIVWTSEMTKRGRKYLPRDDYIIQVWSKSDDENVAGIYNESYRVILSNKDAVYLDHGLGPWKGNRQFEFLKTWQNLYNHDLIGNIEKASGKEVASHMFKSGKLLGGEACMWSEKVDGLNMDRKIWPRTSAYAERLWSNPPKNSTRFAYPRLIHQRETMILRGILPDTLLPEACYHIWGFCDDKY